MDKEAFIRWALDDDRTVEERYTVELLVDQGEMAWCMRHQIRERLNFTQRMERNRERELNPAYDPQYSEENLAKAVEYLAEAKAFDVHSNRPIRTVEPFRFLTSLESFTLHFNSEVADYSPLAELPALRVLKLGYPTNVLFHLHCEDYSFLARCPALRELMLCFNAHWPDLTGLDGTGALAQIETLTLGGNLLAMPRGTSFPNVRRAHFHCAPLATRNVADLPHLPACEILTLAGAQSLDGIEKMPILRNLTLLGPFRSFAPLADLSELTWLNVEPLSHLDLPRFPRDIAPLARLPRLRYFAIGSKIFTPENRCMPDMPRDYSPLADAPDLRELAVRACPPVAMEVAAISAGLLPWDDLFLAPEPRPLPPLRMNIAPDSHAPPPRAEHRIPGETGLIDEGIRECEGRWVSAFTRKIIREYLRQPDWGTLDVTGLTHSMHLTVESFDIVEKLPDILDLMRGVFARLRHEYIATFDIHLRIPPPEPSPAHQQLEAQFRTAQDDWDYQQRQREHMEYLDRLHQIELKQQQGQEIDPGEFSPTERDPYLEPPAPEPDGEENDDGEGNIAVEKKPDPPQLFIDENDHPLAGNYRLWGRITLEEVWFRPENRGLAIHLMQRQPDLDIPDEEKKE